MTTMGDRVLNRALPKIGEKSLFTKDLEEALSIGDIDLIVHSLKDLPTALPDGMAIGAVLDRDDPRDALVLNEKLTGKTLATLPDGSLIGTSSLRRTAQLSRKFPHLKVCDIRGNLNTRLAKLDATQSKFAGIILANAGLQRMGWLKRIDEIIEPKDLLYAVGQGALAVECRSNDCFVLSLLSEICNFNTQCRILSERSFLKTLGGGCSAPVGTNSELSQTTNSGKKSYSLDLSGGVWSLNGETEIIDKLSVKFEIDSKQNDDEQVTPPKRQKLSDSDESPKKASPTIIHDNLTTPSINEAEKLVDVHGKVFESCPFSKASTNEKVHFDASKLPVGLDVMSECPVMNTQQKVNYDAGSSGDATTSGCPVKGRKISLDEIKNEDLNKCPFLSSQVKLIDYEAEAETRLKRTSKSLVENCGDVKLYCGLFCHKDIHQEAFEMCEKLGENLAQKLASVGALEVMKKAQDEIHAKC